MKVVLVCVFGFVLGFAQQNLLLQCKLLLANMEVLHPDIRGLIQKSRHYQTALGERRKLDPFTRLRYMVQQGALLCEMSKFYAIFKSQTTEEVIELKGQTCYYPQSGFISSESSQCKENLQQFITNCGNDVDIPSISELQFPSTTTMLDIIELLETWLDQLSVCLPIYPVIRDLDSTSDNSDTSSTYSTNCLTKLSPVLDELVSTEKTFIISLVQMQEYSNSCNSLLRQFPGDKQLQQRKEWFPYIDRLREFHVEFYVAVQIFRADQVTNIERFSSLFNAFHEILPAYNEWIDSTTRIGAEILAHSQIPAAYPELNEIIPLDKSVNGMASLRIQPMQRLLRYPLFLNELMRGVEEESAKFHLEIAHVIMSGIAARMNEYRRKQENLFLKERYIQSLSSDDQYKTEMQQQELIGNSKTTVRQMDPNTRSIKETPCLLLLFTKGIYLLKQTKERKHLSLEKLPSRPKLHLKRTLTNLRRFYKEPMEDTKTLSTWKTIHVLPFHLFEEIYQLTPHLVRCVLQGDWHDILFETKEQASLFYSIARKAFVTTSTYQNSIMNTIQNCKICFLDHLSRKVVDTLWMVVRLLPHSSVSFESLVDQLCSQLSIRRMNTPFQLWYLDEDKDRIRLETSEDLDVALMMQMEVLTLYLL